MQACLSYIKKSSHDEKKCFFNDVQLYVYQLICATIVLLLLLASINMTYKPYAYDKVHIISCIFYISLLIETVLNVYEQVYKAEEQYAHIALFSIALCIMLFGFIPLSSYISINMITFLGVICALKISQALYLKNKIVHIWDN